MDDIKPPTQPTGSQPGRPISDIGGRPAVSRPVSISITDSTDTQAARPTRPTAPLFSSGLSAPVDATPAVGSSSSLSMSTETPSVGPMTPQVVAEEPTTKEPVLIPGLDKNPGDSSSMSSNASESDPQEIAKNTQSLLEQAAREEKASTESAAMAPMVPAKKSKAPAIIVAVILALALACGAVYAYLLNNKKAEDAAKPVAKTQTTTPAAKADLTKTSTTITDALKKVDDTKDFQEADLTDTTLGL